MKPGAKVVKFVRATDASRSGFVEQELPLADVKPGWIVSATTKHEGAREVAEIVKVVLGEVEESDRAVSTDRR